MAPSYYDVFGLDQTASLPAIRTAYRARVLNHHPDKTLHLSEPEQAKHASLFRRIQEAWETLSDPPRKAAYDQKMRDQPNVFAAKHPKPHNSSLKQRDGPRRPRFTPEERHAKKMKAEEDIAYLNRQRAKFDAENSKRSIDQLQLMIQSWKKVMNDRRGEPGEEQVRTYCFQQIEICHELIKKKKKVQQHQQADSSRSHIHGPTRSPAPRAYTSSTSHYKLELDAKLTERQIDAELAKLRVMVWLTSSLED